MTGAWWRDAVIYQIYPRSFADANGDGIGDIAGIRQQLHYVADLGVDAVWLSPFYRSPMHDAGYDVADYRAIDPLFGSVDEVEALVADAHGMGLRVLIDIVPNHTSNEHVWFQEALASGVPTMAAEARTQFTSGPWSRYHLVRGERSGTAAPNNWKSNFGGPAWTQLDATDGSPSGWWYLHLFDPTQPDLNWESVEVRAEFEDILRFWFDRGVDGFRIDVAHGLVKEPGYPDDHSAAAIAVSGDNPPAPQYDQSGVHDIYRAWRRVADEYDPPRVFVGEVWVQPAARLAPYLRPDELHTSFNFDHVRAPWWAPGLREAIEVSLASASAVGAPTTWVLENHDVWRAPTRYAPMASDPDGSGFTSLLDTSGVYAAPRDLVTGLRRARAALLVMLALPGSAYIYQGQELGLFEVLDLPDELRQDPAFRLTGGAAIGRDGCRVPLPWLRDGQTYGFGPADSTASWLPQPSEWGALSVQAQSGQSESTLELTRSALALRRELPALGDGALAWDEHDLGRTVLSFVRPARGGAKAVRCVIAMEGSAVTLPSEWGTVLIASEGPLVTDTDGRVVLPADTSAWLIPPSLPLSLLSAWGDTQHA